MELTRFFERYIQRRLTASLILWLTLLSVTKIVLMPDLILPSRKQIFNLSGDGPKIEARKRTQTIACEQQLVFNKFSNDLQIPRIIHFTARSEVMLDSYARYLKRWYKSYSNFTFYLWRDVDALCLLQLHYPELLEGFENDLKTPLERSDFIRVLVVYHFGGLYVDMDTLPLRSMKDLFDKPMRGAMVAREPQEHALFLYNLDSLLSNAVMFGIPKHPFYYYYMCKILSQVRQLNPTKRRHNFEATHITGPILLNQVHENYTKLGLCPVEQPECAVHVFEPVEFCPNYDLTQKRRLRYICIRNHRTLSRPKRWLCSSLLYRRFANRRLTPQTFAVHEFRHFSTLKGDAKSSGGTKANGKSSSKCFNALTAIPTLKFYNSTENQCEISDETVLRLMFFGNHTALKLHYKETMDSHNSTDEKC